MRNILAVTAACMTALGLLWSSAQAAPAQISKRPFGKASDGHSVSIYTLTNMHGMKATITNYGGIVTTLRVPDRSGKMGDVVLGYDTLAGYVKSIPYFGAIVGRYANCIAKGKFTLGGKTYTLAVNNGVNHLHGGIHGFDKRVWTATPLHTARGVGLALRYLSRDGEEGYPGDLSVKVVYTLTEDNALQIDYTAMANKDTVVNLTNHSYFNLDGAGSGSILGERMQIFADRFTPTDKGFIPLGNLQPVAGTPFDFRLPIAIGAGIHQKNPQLLLAKGYDHNYALRQPGHALILAARAVAPRSGRVLTVYTTQPGVQFYTGNFLNNMTVGKGGKVYGYQNAFCLETQHYPDSPNHPRFPTTTLKPGQTYRQTTIYRFSTVK